jgi:predicted ABC-type ATPase
MTAGKGYKVHGHYVNTPFETALANNQKRFNDPKERRYVPEEILKHAHVQVSKNFEKLTDLFDEMSLYYNDGKNMPIKIASKQQSDILRVQDGEKYKDFLKKGEMDK